MYTDLHTLTLYLSGLNLMLLNADKSNYMLIIRAVGDYSTRLQLNNNNLHWVKSVKLLGIWLTDTLDWELNTMKKAYARISILSKLKYVGMKMEDLSTVYKTFFRCIVEYCCVVWHSSLTVHQNNALERIQRVCLKIILGKDYVGYISALESCELETLESRRDKLSLSFAKKMY